jgi:hypothetical protein
MDRHTANSTNLSPICGIRQDLTQTFTQNIIYDLSRGVRIENPAYTVCPAYNAFSKFVTNL